MLRYLCLGFFFALFLPPVAGCRRAEVAPLQVGIWYWHTPFQVSPEDAAQLKRMGVTRLYVRAATLATDGDRVHPILPQRWSKAPGFDTTLVFNFDPGLVKHIETMDLARVVADMTGIVDESTRSAENAGLKVSGVQLDVDCPTRLLPRYADLLRRLAPSVRRNGCTFGITALPTWLASASFSRLAEAVDEVVPQFYEGRTGRHFADVAAISDPSGLAAGLDKLDRLGVPCQAGLAAYGHALLYNDRGELAAMYRGLSAEDAMRHPALTVESVSRLPEGEVRLTMRALHADSHGRGKGFRIVYLLPTPSMVSRQIEIVRRNRPGNLRGVILYRFPEPGESMTLPLSSLADAMNGIVPRLDAKLAMSSRAVPYELIGGSSRNSRPPKDLTVDLRSTGNAPTLPGKDSATIQILLDHPGVDEIQLGGFDEVEVGTMVPDGTFLPTAAAHADTVLLRRYHLLPGERLRSGRISLSVDGATSARISWRLRGSDGAIQRGASAEVKL